MYKNDSLRLQRKRIGLTQKELADRTSIGMRQIQRYEADGYDIGNMTLSNAISISNTLKCDVKDLCLDLTNDGKEIKYYYHYGIPVSKQSAYEPFVDTLQKMNVNYTELPLYDYLYKVLTYVYNGIKKYAVIRRCIGIVDYFVEYVYITTSIPDDMSWENLMDDVDNQSKGEEPTRIKTRLRITIDHFLKIQSDAFLEKLAREKINPFVSGYNEPDIDYYHLKDNLEDAGFDDLASCDLQDLDKEFINEIINARYDPSKSYKR